MDRIGRHFASATRKIPGMVAGALESGELRVAGIGTLRNEPQPADLCWEIGSITKVFTGVLLADMSIRGEVNLDDPIGRFLPDSVAGRLPVLDLQPTLSDLATHTAGLPRLPRAIYHIAKASPDPYSALTEDDVFGCLGPKTRRPHRRRSRYSNYGMGLLGHLLARAGDRSYPTLLEGRILRPLGMSATALGSCGAGTTTVPGYRRGKETPPWTFGALAGAGALRSTVADMATFARACLDPPDGVGEALDLARRPIHRRRVNGIGLGWMIRTRTRSGQSTETTWHNGGTYGAASFLAVDSDRSLALISFGNTGPGLMTPLDGPSWALFDELMTDG